MATEIKDCVLTETKYPTVCDKAQEEQSCPEAKSHSHLAKVLHLHKRVKVEKRHVLYTTFVLFVEQISHLTVETLSVSISLSVIFYSKEVWDAIKFIDREV